MLLLQGVMRSHLKRKAIVCAIIALIRFNSAEAASAPLSEPVLNRFLGNWSTLSAGFVKAYCTYGKGKFHEIDKTRLEEILRSRGVDLQEIRDKPISSNSARLKSFEIRMSSGEILTVKQDSTPILITDDGAKPYFKDHTIITVEKYPSTNGFALQFGGSSCLPIRASLSSKSSTGSVSINVLEVQNGKAVDLNHPDPRPLHSIYLGGCKMSSQGFKQIENLVSDTDKVLVAVMDDGADYNHPDLASKMPRDQLGWDFVGNSARPYPLLNTISERESKLTKEKHTHGTHVAGIIAKNNEHVQLMALRIDSFMDPQSGSDAIAYAAKQGVRIINMSFGSCDSKPWKPIEQAMKAHPEILFVVAAGNGDGFDGSKIVPGQRDNDVINCAISPTPLPNVVHVAAVDSKGDLAEFSRYGKKTVEIAAPGVDIVSSKAGGGRISMSGTSMASPEVARVASLVLKANPSLQPSDVLDILKTTVVRRHDLEDKLAWAGVLDEQAAIALARTLTR